MLMKQNSSAGSSPQIVAVPPGPLFRLCPRCGKWFALVFEGVEYNPQGIMLKVYRCKKCKGVTKFGDTKPRHAI